MIHTSTIAQAHSYNAVTGLYREASWVLKKQSTVDVFPVDDTQSEERPTALSGLPQNMTTCSMN
jgi:hypothetical protein